MKLKHLKPRRVRLSLETDEAFKERLVHHGQQLGESSLIGTIRKAVERSEELREIEKGVKP